MTVKPFRGLFADGIREVLPLLTGQETKVFLAMVSYCDTSGKAHAGQRELADLTTYSQPIVSELMASLCRKGIAVMVRRDARDSETGRLLPNVYAINPKILLCAEAPAFFRYVNMPDNHLREDFAQEYRINKTESGKEESIKQNQQHFEGAASLSNANTAMATRSFEGASRNTTPQRQQTTATASPYNNSDSKYPKNSDSNSPSPSSAAPPPRELTFSEAICANQIRQHVKDMNDVTARRLVVTYGTEQVYAAVNSYVERNKKAPIAKPTGWIIANLRSGRKKE